MASPMERIMRRDSTSQTFLPLQYPPAEPTIEAWQAELETISTPDGDIERPKKFRSELMSKASGAIIVLISLAVLWILTVMFVTRFAHEGIGPFNVVIALQYLLWTLHRQGMSIIALVLFDFIYTRTDRHGNRRGLTLYALDAWMSLIITPINILRGKALHILLVLLPAIFSVFATYATSSLLGNDTAFRLVETGLNTTVQVGPAGGGRANAYVMTGNNFIYNTSSAGRISRPNSRFVYVINDSAVLIPSIPRMGTYANDSSLLALKIRNVPSVLCTVRTRVEKDRETLPPNDPAVTSVQSFGDIYYEAINPGAGKGLVSVSIILRLADVFRQIYFDLSYQTVTSDLLFATFNNGTHINRLYGVNYVTKTMPDRLSGGSNLTMDSVLDNFILSQKGNLLVHTENPQNLDVTNLGLLLGGAFGIRSARGQNWLDGAGVFDANILEQREIRVIHAGYWTAASVMSSLLALACISMFFRRPTINGNLVQLVALLEGFVQGCWGACTPKWMRSRVANGAYEEVFMNIPLKLGYSAENGVKKVERMFTADGKILESYHLALDVEKHIAPDDVGVVYDRLAGCPGGTRKGRRRRGDGRDNNRGLF